MVDRVLVEMSRSVATATDLFPDWIGKRPGRPHHGRWNGDRQIPEENSVSGRIGAAAPPGIRRGL